MEIKKLNHLSFKGMAMRLPNRVIRDANDAIIQWELLRHPKFTNVFQEEEIVNENTIIQNKLIREENYSFLDKLFRKEDKEQFIEHFKILTGFPSLTNIAQKMIDEFHRVLNIAIKKMGKKSDDILLSGYDKFCSVELGAALPGSDIDKAYTIIKGIDGNLTKQRLFSDLFKEQIWENIDNRIMSVNHCAAFPNVMTENELIMSLENIDKYTHNIVGTENRYKLFLQERMYNSNPVSSAKFNIWLSETLQGRSEKINAKNLAYIIETIRDGARRIINYNFIEKLFNSMDNSLFAMCSNIIQGYPMAYKYSVAGDIITKPKLKARIEMEKNFNNWDIDTQYELVKDIIRSMSGDNKNPKFKQLFYSKTDKHRLLINDILKGDVNCAFTFFPNGGEQIDLFFNTPKTVKRYYNFNVYKMDY